MDLETKLKLANKSLANAEEIYKQKSLELSKEIEDDPRAGQGSAFLEKYLLELDLLGNVLTAAEEKYGIEAKLRRLKNN